jgi:hypothetical protein
VEEKIKAKNPCFHEIYNWDRKEERKIITI